MADFRKMYFSLFNAITDALEALGRQDFGTAAEILKAAQIAGEERYLADEEKYEKTQEIGM